MTPDPVDRDLWAPALLGVLIYEVVYVVYELDRRGVYGRIRRAIHHATREPKEVTR